MGHSMTQDHPSLAELRNRLGAAQNRVHMHEITTGTRPSPTYNAMLQACADARSALRCAVAELEHEYSSDIMAAYGC